MKKTKIYIMYLHICTEEKTVSLFGELKFVYDIFVFIVFVQIKILLKHFRLNIILTEINHRPSRIRPSGFSSKKRHSKWDKEEAIDDIFFGEMGIHYLIYRWKDNFISCRLDNNFFHKLRIRQQHGNNNHI